jgi:serine protease Do
MKGEVVGIVTIKYSGPTSSGAIIEGIAFAIPTDDIVSKVQDIIDYGYVTGAYLGVSVTEMDREAANYYGLPMGVYVAQVVKGNCAYTAGVREKDIIIGLGDNTITGLNDLTRALQKFEAGDKTTITVWRGGQELVFDIVLDEKPQQ